MYLRTMLHRRSLPQRMSDSFRVIRELDLSHRYERQAGTVTLAVGLLVVAAALLAGWAVGGRGPVRATVEFASAQGLSGGDPVVVAGVPVGRVRRVELTEPGRVRVTLTIRRSHRPHRDARFEIVSVNLVGGMAVVYRPGADTALLAADTVVVGDTPHDVGARIAELKGVVEDVAVGGRAFLRPDFAADLAAARAATARAHASLARAGAGPAAAAADALASGQAALAALDSLVDRLPHDSARLSELGANLGDLMLGVGDARERLAAIQERIARGEGNLGRATRDSALRLELEAARLSLDHLLLKYLGRRPADRRAEGSTDRDSS